MRIYSTILLSTLLLAAMNRHTPTPINVALSPNSEVMAVLATQGNSAEAQAVPHRGSGR
ncbi:MAG: heterocyst-inhibiting protein PatX [Planktothrix sp.]